jgi:hypothetical protein
MYAGIVVQTLTYLTLDRFGTPLLTSVQPAGAGTPEAITLRDVHGGQLWAVHLVAHLLAGLLTLQLTPIAAPAPLSGEHVLMLDPHIALQYVVLLDSTAVPWYLFLEHGELTYTAIVPAAAVNVTPAGGPYTWWQWPRLDGQTRAISVTPWGELQDADTPPAGLGMATPTTLGDADGHLWHLGVAPDASLGLTDAPAIDYSQAATCLVLNDEREARWYWTVDSMTQELVCLAGLEPDLVPWQAHGELGFLTATDPGSGRLWYLMAAPTQEAEVRRAPNLAQPWGMPAADCPLYTPDGHPWVLRLETDGSIWAAEQPVADIPYGTPILYAREAAEALRHVEGSGSITTLWAV